MRAAIWMVRLEPSGLGAPVVHGLTLIGPAVDVRAMELVCNHEHPNSEVVHKPVVRRGRRDASDWRSGGSNGLPAEQGPRIAGHPLAGQQLTLLVLPVDIMAQIRVIVSPPRQVVEPYHRNTADPEVSWCITEP